MQSHDMLGLPHAFLLAVRIPVGERINSWAHLRPLGRMLSQSRLASQVGSRTASLACGGSYDTGEKGNPSAAQPDARGG